jgi:hypothetical protein
MARRSGIWRRTAKAIASSPLRGAQLSDLRGTLTRESSRPHFEISRLVRPDYPQSGPREWRSLNCLAGHVRLEVRRETGKE